VSNLFTILKQQHEEVEGLLVQLETPPQRSTLDETARWHLARHLVIAESRHEAAEEAVVWPAVRKRVDGGEALAGKAVEQERDGRYFLDNLRFAEGGEPRNELIAEYGSAAREHIRFEEDEVWPALRDATSRLAQVVLGAELSLAHRLAPTRPHPRGPDRPLGLATLGLPTATMDRLRDRLSAGRREGSGPMPNAIEVLTRDHGTVEGLFRQVPGDGIPEAQVVAAIVRELSVHDAIEKEHLYPVVRARMAEGNRVSARSITEHGEVARVLGEIDRRSPDDPHRRDLLAELMPAVRAHVAEEEGEIFPALQARMAPEELDELGATLAAAKAKAPTRPHPHAPQSSLGSRAARLVAAPLDKARDLVQRRRP
jgi:hemerythrin superfamily protein